MSQELVQVKKFKPHQDLLELADMIRNLKSTQVMRSFTWNSNFNKRCVLGALAVEYFGSKDDTDSIVEIIGNSWIGNFKTIYKTKLDKCSGGTNTYDMDLRSRLVYMNDHGRTFNEIASWVELEAYRLGS